MESKVQISRKGRKEGPCIGNFMTARQISLNPKNNFAGFLSFNSRGGFRKVYLEAKSHRLTAIELRGPLALTKYSSHDRKGKWKYQIPTALEFNSVFETCLLRPGMSCTECTAVATLA